MRRLASLKTIDRKEMQSGSSDSPDPPRSVRQVAPYELENEIQFKKRTEFENESGGSA
jgi:hypothetical protein